MKPHTIKSATHRDAWLVITAIIFSTSKGSWFIFGRNEEDNQEYHVESGELPFLFPGMYIFKQGQPHRFLPWMDICKIKKPYPWRKKTLKILYCFSGLPRRGDIKHCLELLSEFTLYNIHMTELDIRRNAKHNLLCISLQEQLLRQVSHGDFEVLIISPPCTTWSRARHRHPGPRPLRDIDAPLGLQGLLPFETLQLTEGTDLALWSISMCKHQNRSNGLFLMEHPEWLGKPQDHTNRRPGVPASIFMLHESIHLQHESKGISVALQQCFFGCTHSKPTRFLSNIYSFLNVPHMVNSPPKVNMDMEYIGPLTKCHHRHPANAVDSHGHFVTSALQSYPIPLCLTIASCILQMFENNDAAHHEECVHFTGCDMIK
jgi:hypothetical protein